MYSIMLIIIIGGLILTNLLCIGYISEITHITLSFEIVGEYVFIKHYKLPTFQAVKKINLASKRDFILPFIM